MSNNRFDEINRLASNAVIKVIGVGGGGGNALNTMIESGLTGVEFIAANTDVQALHANLSPIKIQLGKELTKGLGAGANPETGRNAALEDKAILQDVIHGADMVFVTGGMGGGTGTGAAPIIAQVAREMGALTVGVVTKPFGFEGKRRKQQSELGIQALRQSVDTLITIPNQRLLSIAPQDMSMLDGFKLADEILLNAVKGISDIINIPGRVNVDFADVKTIMSEMGMALMGIGTGSGPNRATEAAKSAINSPLLEEIDIEGATGILINITGTSSMTLHEISEASTLIQEAAHEDANIIFGAVIDENMGEFVRVTVIATGFDQARIAYPDQNFTNLVQQGNQFLQSNQSNVQQTKSGHGYPQNNPNVYNNNLFEKRSLHSMNNFAQQTPSSAQNNFNRSFTQNKPTAQNYPSTNQQNQQIPIHRMPDLNPPPSYKNTPTIQQTNLPDISSPVATMNNWNPQPVSRNNEVEESPISNEDNSIHQDSRVGASTIIPQEVDNDTQAALKIAHDLSHLPMDETDFETPTFMRKKDEAARGF